MGKEPLQQHNLSGYTEAETKDKYPVKSRVHAVSRLPNQRLMQTTECQTNLPQQYIKHQRQNREKQALLMPQ